ncbi:MAG: 3-dehydroquinate synthase [Bacteroidia bacterium]|nr:3-dehydroquinate synthase [Bacteroidia bacterium]
MSNPANLVFTSNAGFVLREWLEAKDIINPIILCDENTAKYCFSKLGLSSDRLIVIPAGEQFKNLDTLSFVLDKLYQLELKRNDIIVNLGGGVVSDLGGFAASIFRRGIRYLNVPTTLLAMVDAAIGGKTGIDYKHLKNYLGTFQLPEVVILSTEFLETLPTEHIIAAKAEIIKTAAIYDSELFEMIENNESLDLLIHRCAHNKAELVSQDFKDNKERQLLNFGHTIGHALESFMLEKGTPILHGIAIASGMLLEIKLAFNKGILSLTDCQRISQLIQKEIGVEMPTEVELKGLKKFLANDKKNSSSKIIFSFPTVIGQGRYGVNLTLEEIMR